MSSLSNNPSLSSVGIGFIEMGEAVLPCGSFIELVGLIRESCRWRLLEDLMAGDEVVSSAR